MGEMGEMGEIGDYSERRREDVPSSVLDFWRRHLEIDGDRATVATAAREMLKNREWVAANPDLMVALNKAMIAGAVILNPALDGKLHSLECEWNRGDGVTVTIPYIGVGVGDEIRPMYFFSGYSFHPDVRPTWKAANKRTELIPPRKDRVFVVDTGWCDPVPPGVDTVDVDRIPYHRAKGHGPAIVGLIEQLGGSGLEVHLRQIRYDEGTLKCPVPLPVPTGEDELVVGFDEQALHATLTHLANELEAPDIVNLSLGTTPCPHLMKHDPVGDWMKDQRGIRFVVAAGNHGTELPSWPAAYAPGIPNPTATGGGHTVEVHSVGSGTKANPDDFSGRGDDWVTEWYDGSDVSVPIPASVQQGNPQKTPAGLNNGTWRGTSFAAPQHAAKIARSTTIPGGGVIDATSEGGFINLVKDNPRQAAGRAFTAFKGTVQSLRKKR